MPFSFVDIEAKRSRTIFLAFISIVLVYFLAAYLLSLAAIAFLASDASRAGIPATAFPKTVPVALAMLVAAVAALLHWQLSVHRIIDRLSAAIGARPIDPQDAYHRYLRNIVEEVSVAVGGRKIEPMVIRSPGMNAFALADYHGRAVIGVTEGLLARLNRSQIEAVVAHEAAHIANGDCLTATILCALGEMHEEGLRALSRIGGGMRRADVRTAAFVGLAYAVLGLTGILSGVLRCFLSREREYRADAAAVRLSRDPLSLAEALRMLSRNWRGAGGAGEALQSIFILNPAENRLDEKEGFLSDMFSTHPPVAKRLAVLLSLAHLDEHTLDERLNNFRRVSPVARPTYSRDDQAPAEKWLARHDGRWEGPFSPAELAGMEWFVPSVWVRAEGSEDLKAASDEPALRSVFQKQEFTENAGMCPDCKTGLQKIGYEGASALRCQYCGGIFADNDALSRILIRRDYEPSEEVRRIVGLLKERPATVSYTNKDGRAVMAMDCPKCGAKMHRQFFVYSYPVEVDRCIRCGGVWFEKEELEILQGLYEARET